MSSPAVPVVDPCPGGGPGGGGGGGGGFCDIHQDLKECDQEESEGLFLLVGRNVCDAVRQECDGLQPVTKALSKTAMRTSIVTILHERALRATFC